MLPLLGWYFAVQDPETPYWVLLGLAFLAGLGGGNFSSFMPSTSLFFPKQKLRVRRSAIQAGLGNFGVSLVQFLSPWLIGFALLGSAVNTKTGADVYLQNALLIWMPLVVIRSRSSPGSRLRSVPVHADMHEQMDIFREKHTYTMTSLYMMTFGTFSGLAAAFPILIKNRVRRLRGRTGPADLRVHRPARRLAGADPCRAGLRPHRRRPRSRRSPAIGADRSSPSLVSFCVQPDSPSDFKPFVLVHGRRSSSSPGSATPRRSSRSRPSSRPSRRRA